jgi:predicted metalloprotease
VPWTPNAAVRSGGASNELLVKAQGPSIVFLVNGVEVAHITTDLPPGGVGIFVGGDGNHVVLEHFAVSSGAPSAVSATPAPARGEARAALLALTPAPVAVPTSAPSLPLSDRPLREFTSAVLNDVDEFWSLQFSQRGSKYTPASRNSFDTRTSMPCGPAVPWVAGSFY